MSLQDGSAHGRFQPLHNGHLEYLLAAKGKCGHLWVGITQPDIRTLKQTADVHRGFPASNPLTFAERFAIITEALVDAGIDRGGFSVIPFPIEDPPCLPDYLPTTTRVFTTIYDEWNRHKVDVLTAAGYSVEVLWERTVKEFVGARIRQLMIAGDDTWKREVPTATIRMAERIDLAARLRTLDMR